MTTFGFHMKNAGEEPGTDLLELIREILRRLGGLSFMVLSKEEFDALEVKEPATVYFVYNGNKVTQYIGEAQLGGASITAGSIFPNIRNSMSILTGTITEV